MKIIKVSGDDLQDMIQQVINQFGTLENVTPSRPKAKSEKKETPDRDHYVCDISKAFWINRQDLKGNDGSETSIMEFNVIAPFVIKDTIKATIYKVDDEQILSLNYSNDDSIFGKCTSCNFKIKKDISYKYSFAGYKVNKKKVKLTYENGIIKVVVPVSKDTSNSEFVIGLS